MLPDPQPFLHDPTRRTQPYRATAPRPPGATLAAMLAGRDANGHNPMDAQRRMQRKQPLTLADLLSRLPGA